MSDSPPTANPSESRPARRKERQSVAYFWRALRYLSPHRKLVVISIGCAFVVGLTFTGGLSAMLPILRVLMSGETVQTWAGRIVAEQRLGVKLAESPDKVLIDHVRHDGAAARAGLKAGDLLGIPGAEAEKTLAALCDPAATSVTVQVTRNGQQQSLAVSPPPTASDQDAFLRATNLLPRHPVWAIAAVMGFMFALALIGNFVRFYQEYFSDKAAILAVNDIRRKLYDHVLHIPVGFFGLKGTSDVTSRLVQDAQGLQDGFKTVLGQTIQDNPEPGRTVTFDRTLHVPTSGNPGSTVTP